MAVQNTIHLHGAIRLLFPVTEQRCVFETKYLMSIISHDDLSNVWIL